MTPSSANPITNFDWAQFGLSGLVIAAMFVTLFFVVRMHRDERKEWREDSNKRAEKTDDVIKEFTTAINEMRRERG